MNSLSTLQKKEIISPMVLQQGRHYKVQDVHRRLQYNATQLPKITYLYYQQHLKGFCQENIFLFLFSKDKQIDKNIGVARFIKITRIKGSSRSLKKRFDNKNGTCQNIERRRGYR